MRPFFWVKALTTTVLFVCFVYWLLPKSAEVEVTDVGWECQIEIQELRTVSESGWSYPKGARVRSTASEINHYIYIDDVPTPVYMTKYYYDVERWVDSRVVKTTGNNREPYYGEVELAEGSGEYEVGKEREGERKTKYTVTGKVNGEEKTFFVTSKSWWEEINVGDKLQVKIADDGRMIRRK